MDALLFGLKSILKIVLKKENQENEMFLIIFYLKIFVDIHF